MIIVNVLKVRCKEENVGIIEWGRFVLSSHFLDGNHLSKPLAQQAFTEK